MRARTRIATLLVAWLVLIPIAVIVPSSPASAAVPEDRDALTLNSLTRDPLHRDPVEIEFGQRLSRGSSKAAATSSAAIESSSAPTLFLLEKPEFRIWPDENLNQVVNLDSFLMITDGFEYQDWCFCTPWFYLYIQAYPVGSIFQFRETDTGVRHNEDCLGPGIPWFFGLDDSSSFPFCGREWDHSSDVTGEVEARARVLHLVFFNGVGPVPMKSQAGDEKMLDVGEVLSVGQTISLPVVEASPGTDESGFCSVWGISVLCWIGETAYDAAVEAILVAAPVLREVKRFFEGCAAAALDAAGGLVDILRELGDAITSPIDFVTEKVQEFRDLLAAIEENPTEFAKEVLGDLAMLDVLEEQGLAVWLGKVTCMLAIEYFTGKAADTIISAARAWRRNRHNNDPDRPPDPDCILNSFPGDTQVLMADGGHERIDSIRPGDWVISHNLNTSVWEPQLVVDQWSHPERGPPATLTLLDDSTVTATANHEFWVASTAQWVELQFVRPGEELLSPAGPVAVADVRVGSPQAWTVWELTVEGNHNFTVLAGETDLLVHNYTCQPNPRQLSERTTETSDRLRRDGLDVTPEEVGQAWQRYLEEHPDADFDTWQGQYENIRRNNHLGNAHEQSILDQYEPGMPKNGQTFPDPNGGTDFKPDAVLGTDPPHFVEIKDYQNTVLYPGSNAGKQLEYIRQHALENPTNPGTFDLHITDPSNISTGMQQLIDDARDAGVTVNINPTP